jgi:aspartyl-tRNA synthetase
MFITDFKKITSSLLEQELTVAGFVDTIRDHGGLIFIDVRNGGEVVQVVVHPETNPEAFAIAESLHSEYTIKVTGMLTNRSQETVNTNLLTGQFEVTTSTIEIVSKAKTLPFDIHETGSNLANEDLRLKYRYLDLRRKKLRELLIHKSNFFLAIRNWMNELGFIEVHTPILANSTPEGARDYLVPSRIFPGKFFALPQSPQQFKQLLMVGDIAKYYQISPCFRDEDPRADRHPGDFYQVDVEIAWAKPEDIKELSWKLINEVFSKYSTKKLAPEFKTVTYQDAVENYGSDKPDLRFDLGWKNVKSLFAGTEFKPFANLCDTETSRVQALVVPGAVEKFSRSDLDKVQDIGRSFGLPGIAYIQYFEIEDKSPIFKFFGSEEESKKAEIKQFLGVGKGDLVLFVANESSTIVQKAQHAMRTHIAKHLGLIDDSVMQFVWIDNMPFFEDDEKSGGVAFGHNPFSVWEGGLEVLLAAKAKGKEALLDLKAQQYDVAVNGYEVLSGGVRNQDPETLREVFRICGYTDEEVERNFGHMIEAYSYGAPQHAGFAWGIDRLFMVLAHEENIREIIAFPKNGSGVDVMMNSPSLIRPSQLKELGLKLLDQ